MRCPTDSTELVIVERQGINTHACPVCRGVWLERDDLDEIINRSIPGGIPAVAGAEVSRGLANGLDDDDRGRDSDRSRRRRDKYSDDFVEFERPRKAKKQRRGGRQDEYEDMLDF